MRGDTGILGEQGATFIEVLLAGVIGLLVTGAIFYFVNFAGQGTQQIQALQQLQQESSLITELFSRNLRNGTFVCAGSQASAPTADTDNLTQITVRKKDSTVLATFGIANDSFSMNGTRYLTAYLCGFRSPLSHFKIFQNGKTAECFLSMFTSTGSDTVFYTQTIGELRCRN
jgi:Tfp pilus assembly protein PilW